VKDLKDLIFSVIRLEEEEEKLVKEEMTIEEFLKEQELEMDQKLLSQLKMENILSLVQFFEEKLRLRDYMFTRLPASARAPIDKEISDSIRSAFHIEYEDKQRGIEEIQNLIKELQDYEQEFIKLERNTKETFEILGWEKDEPPVNLIPDSVIIIFH